MDVCGCDCIWRSKYKPQSLHAPIAQYVRDKRAGYSQSLLALAAAKKARPSLYTKTSLMLGLGESDEEVGMFEQ